MKILVITDEVWNDKVHGNNVLSNWFNGFEAEFANIYCSPGRPLNKCCKYYFQITDTMMAKSIIGKQRAGEPFFVENPLSDENFLGEEENNRLYTKLKSMTTESLRVIREMIWCFGIYNIDALQKFIYDFKPDIIFSPRMATLKILRLEKLVYDIAKVPMVAFTGDAEYSMKLFRITPVFWMKKIILRKKFREMMPNYSLYYSLSDEQLQEYQAEFGSKFKILRKCGDFSRDIVDTEINNPIKIIYAGKLYSNRWKTLVTIGQALKIINELETKIVLEIYTRDKLTKKQRMSLDDGKNVFFKGSATPEELKFMYSNSDIALHVEAFDLKNRLQTRVSFSTKIIDCLASGCAVMVISWDKHSGYTYLKNMKSAFLISKKSSILSELKRIADKPELIKEYRIKALECGRQNHQKEDIQKMLYNDFVQIINNRC